LCSGEAVPGAGQEGVGSGPRGDEGRPPGPAESAGGRGPQGRPGGRHPHQQTLPKLATTGAASPGPGRHTPPPPRPHPPPPPSPRRPPGPPRHARPPRGRPPLRPRHGAGGEPAVTPLPQPEVVGCYFDIGFVPPIAAMVLRWPGAGGEDARPWALPGGEL